MGIALAGIDFDELLSVEMTLSDRLLEMAVEITSLLLHIIFGSSNSYIYLAQVYDSKTNSWYMTSSLPKRVALVTGAAYINGYLYSMSLGAAAGVLAFDVREGTWHELKVKMPLNLVCPQLIGHRGQLLMVGGVEEYRTLRSVHLWRLDMTRSEWLEVQRMPDTLFNTLFK